jgi:hypothetical protein
MNVLFYRQSEVEMQETEGGLRTQLFTATDNTDIDFAAFSHRLGQRNRQIDQYWLQMVGDSHSSICYSRRTVHTDSRLAVYFDATFVRAQVSFCERIQFERSYVLCLGRPSCLAFLQVPHGTNLQVPIAFEYYRFIWN